MQHYEDKHGIFIPVRHKDDVPWIKAAKGSMFLARTFTWYIPKTEANRKLLQDKGFIQKVTKVVEKPIPKKKLAKLPKKLYDIQKEALQYLYSRNGSAVVALDMGLGKTATSLCYTLLEDIKCTLVLCQSSTKTQWKKEIKQWLNEDDVYIINGQKKQVFKPHKFLIMNYEIFTFHVKELSKLNLDLVIIDEVQFFQNKDSKRTQALFDIAVKSKRIMALSGTPITRRPVQFYPILHILRPDKFTTFENYTLRYCDAKMGPMGYEYDGVSNVPEFREIIQEVMIRRSKKDSIDIPDKLIIPVLFELKGKEKAAYLEEEKEMLTEVFGKKRAVDREGNLDLTYLQYMAYLSKRKDMMAWIKDFIVDNKLVIFCEHRKIVEDIYNEFEKDAVKYYGGLTTQKKDEAKEAFLNDKKLFVGNTTSAGTGLDGLQKACHNVAFVELPWTSSKFDQATDRLWRGGQTKNVNVYVLIAKDSIEEKVMGVLDKSRAIVENIIDGKSRKEVNLLRDVIKEYQKERRF